MKLKEKIEAVYLFLIRTKLYHLPFWIVYNLFWSFLFGNGIRDSTSLLITLNYLVFQMVGGYFNIYFLIPRFLKQGKWISYLLLFIFDIFISGSLLLVGYYLILPSESQVYFIQSSIYHHNNEIIMIQCKRRSQSKVLKP